MTDFIPSFDSDAQPVAQRQIAALCWRKKRGGIEILLITSRETGRWVIPKGWPMKNRDSHEAAAIEAWEEAGVQGVVREESIGVFGYHKLYPAKPAVFCEVDVYPLRVAKLVAKFPEQSERRRKWFSTKKAAKSVHEGGLSEILLAASKALIRG
jgi:8-oxo-dGTP pyrophosphatase MutT (NUDIX family)